MYLFFESTWVSRKRELEDFLRSSYCLSKPIPSHLCENSFCSRKPIENFNMAELLKYYWIKKFHKSAFMIALPIELKSDSELIHQFGCDYLGNVSGAVKKNALQSLVLAYRRIAQVESSRKFFSVPTYVIEERLKQAPFSESEINQLVELQDKNLHLVDKFIKKKVDKLKQELDDLPIILKKGIG